MSDLKHISKFLSLVLRHDPAKVGITLDAAGWVEVEVLLPACAGNGKRISRESLDRVVAENDKKRFEFSPDGVRIRASQGHSVEVDLGYVPMVPPTSLFHGTATKNVSAILAEGIHRGSRHAVHLSETADTAVAVGTRHGRPVVLVVDSGAMHAAGFIFERSTNGVWLTAEVPPKFVRVETA